MAKLIVVWPKPDDAEAFDEDYLGTHMPLADALPGVTTDTGPVVDGDGHRVTILSFESLDALQAAFSSDAAGPLMEDSRRLQERYQRTPTRITVA